MKTKQDLIIEKQRELIKMYDVVPDEDQEYEFYLWDKRLREIDKELKALESQEELKPTDEDIETWSIGETMSYFGQGMIQYGAKALRDGNIPVGEKKNKEV